MKRKNMNGRLKSPGNPEVQGPVVAKRSVADLTRQPYRGAPSNAPTVYREAKPNNPADAGVFATGRPALARGFNRRGGLEKIVTGSLAVARPLAGRPLF